MYHRHLADLEVICPTTAVDRTHIYHLYVIRVRDRDGIQAQLAARGISTLIHYPIPLHKQDAYRGAQYPNLPVTENLAEQILSLPMWPHMNSQQLEETVSALRHAVASA